MEIRWQVDDGYSGGSRPQKVKFNIEAWDDDDIDSDEIWEAVTDVVQDEFNQKISWFIENEGEIREAIDEFINKRKEAK